MRRALLLLLSCALPLAASSAAPAAPVSTAATAFAGISKRFLDGLAQLTPVNATQLGDHRHDSDVDDLSTAGA